jgi:hypothetical protein
MFPSSSGVEVILWWWGMEREKDEMDEEGWWWMILREMDERLPYLGPLPKACPSMWMVLVTYPRDDGGIGATVTDDGAGASSMIDDDGWSINILALLADLCSPWFAILKEW